MRFGHMLSIGAAVVVLSSGCSSSAHTLAAGPATPAESVAPDAEPAQQAADEDAPQQAPTLPDPPADEAPAVGTLPDVEPVPAWQEQPLARVMLTEADLATLGLDEGWELGYTDFIEIAPSSQSTDTICGVATPQQSSYFGASFEHPTAELELNVMPATAEISVASDFLDAFELLTTCPNPEEELSGVEMQIVTVDVDGADRSLVISGTDATSANEPAGLTLAAANVDGHLFMAFVLQADGAPATGDVALAVGAVELSISRL